MVNKNQICIVIPIYKLQLNSFEIKSVEQCLKVLLGYSLYFVCSKQLDISFYKEKFPEVKQYAFFNENYFGNLKGYNQLLLSSLYYDTFKAFQYMLIYQTDAYVFKDELLTWSKKGYDYIGGLLFEGFRGNPQKGAKLWCAGNGGLSLRNINTFATVLKSKKRLKNRSQLIQERKSLGKQKGLMKRLKINILYFLKRFGYKNNVSFYAKNFDNNEDVFFISLCEKYNVMSMPKVSDAMYFSWDRCPEYLFNRVGKLPFGCHAWFRDDVPYERNKEFWLKILTKESFK